LQRTLQDPARSVIPANRNVVAVTRDGKPIRGRRLNEDTYTIQLIDEEERLVSLPKSDLRSLQIVATSAMPPYEKTLSADEIAALDVTELKQRFLVVQAVEAARTFEEHVVTDVREADVGSILGFGFAPFTGGTLSYIDMMGVKAFVDLCRKFETKYGARFKPGKLLVEMADKGESFYGRFGPPKAKAA
jgi:hypothetical protein